MPYDPKVDPFASSDENEASLPRHTLIFRRTCTVITAIFSVIVVANGRLHLPLLFFIIVGVLIAIVVFGGTYFISRYESRIANLETYVPPMIDEEIEDNPPEE